MPVEDKEYYKGLEFRISELEKKLNELEDMQETIVETDPVRMDTRIEELEKWNRQALDNNEANAYDIKGNVERLEKLENNNTILTKDMFEWVQYFVKSGLCEQIMDKISELKEKLEVSDSEGGKDGDSTPKCDIKGCNKKVVCNDFCEDHYLKGKEPTEDFLNICPWCGLERDKIRVFKADLEKLIDFQVPDKFRREMEEKYLGKKEDADD